MASIREQWRPIPGWDGYEVSDLGSVRSRRRPAPRVLRPSVSPTGYLRVGLYGDNASGYRYKPTTLTVHRLVMAAFVGPCPDGKEVRHLDGDPANNRLGNLAYGSRSENAHDSVAHGTHPGLIPHCDSGHRMSKANTHRDEGGAAWCRTCMDAYDAWQARKVAVS